MLFTRSPENEARQKPLSPRLTFGERVELYEAFTRHVLQQAEAAGYPVLIATDAPEYDFGRHAGNIAAVLPQRGESFGQKLSSAMAQAFALGFEEIVCVGNDCLELAAVDLQAAFAQLAASPLVLGAARDGGVYLIGMQRCAAAQTLRALALCQWQTGIARRDLLSAARRLGLAAVVLATREDIDSPAALIAASRRLPALPFLQKAAAQISGRIYFAFPLHSNSLSRHYDRRRFQKSPPAVRS